MSSIGCSTCFEAFTPECEVSTTPCNHLFHTNCITEWIETGRKNCPKCRKPCKINQLRKIFFCTVADQNKSDALQADLEFIELTEKIRKLEKIVEELICEKNPQTPLFRAAKFGDKRIYELITDEIVEINPKDENGKTPLHVAAEFGNEDTLKLIISQIEDKNPKYNYGNTPLHRAAVLKQNANIYKLIMDEVYDKNPKNNGGWTPLHMAAKFSNEDISKLIISQVEEKIQKMLQELLLFMKQPVKGMHTSTN